MKGKLPGRSSEGADPTQCSVDEREIHMLNVSRQSLGPKYSSHDGCGTHWLMHAIGGLLKMP